MNSALRYLDEPYEPYEDEEIPRTARIQTPRERMVNLENVTKEAVEEPAPAEAAVGATEADEAT